MFFFYKVYYGIRTAQINELINCVFKQSEMRNHLLRSLEEKVLSMFPVEKIGVHCINCIEIFCSCRMPMEGKMIECSGMQGVVPLGLWDGCSRKSCT